LLHDHNATHALHSVWSFLLYLAETVIFLISGLFIGSEIMDDSSPLGLSDFLGVFILFVGSILARYIAVFVFKPVLNLLATSKAYEISWGEYNVMCFGGLRGSHSLLLSLLLGHEAMLFDKHFPEKSIVYVSGVVLLSLLI
jgi:NhaP-type Na+/H+ or K+/H+ antiporter